MEVKSQDRWAGGLGCSGSAHPIAWDLTMSWIRHSCALAMDKDIVRESSRVPSGRLALEVASSRVLWIGIQPAQLPSPSCKELNKNGGFCSSWLDFRPANGNTRDARIRGFENARKALLYITQTRFLAAGLQFVNVLFVHDKVNGIISRTSLRKMTRDASHHQSFRLVTLSG